MSITAALLALVSSIMWSFFDLTRKQLTQYIPTSMLTFLLITGQIPFYIFWAYTTEGLVVNEGYWKYGVACAILNLYANVAFIQSVRIAELSRTIPVLTLTPVFASVIAWFAMDETLSTIQMAGIGLVFIGSIGIQGPALKSLIGKKVEGRDKTQVTGMLLMATVALGWAGASSLDKVSMEYSSPASHAIIQCAMVSLVLFLYIRILRQGPSKLTINKKVINIYCAALIVAVLALGLQLLAIQQAYVGLIEATKRSTGIIFAIVLGRLFFNERITAWKITTGTVIVAGLWLLLM